MGGEAGAGAGVARGAGADCAKATGAALKAMAAVSEKSSPLDIMAIL
jgi:hypothetical protein